MALRTSTASRGKGSFQPFIFRGLADVSKAGKGGWGGRAWGMIEFL